MSLEQAALAGAALSWLWLLLSGLLHRRTERALRREAEYAKSELAFYKDVCNQLNRQLTDEIRLRHAAEERAGGDGDVPQHSQAAQQGGGNG